MLKKNITLQFSSRINVFTFGSTKYQVSVKCWKLGKASCFQSWRFLPIYWDIYAVYAHMRKKMKEVEERRSSTSDITEDRIQHKRSQRISVVMAKETLITACVKLATESGRPFSLM